MTLTRRFAAGVTVGILALVAAAPGSAQTRTPPPSSAPVTPPEAADWVKTPTPEQRRQMREAANVKLGSRAIVRCHVDAAGLLSSCAGVVENPAGSGYTQALAGLAPFYQMKPESIAAKAPNGLVTLIDETFRYDAPPAWVRKPTADDLITVWPKAAWAKRVGGRALINCLISIQGAIYDCAIVLETPAGENFGGAAIALTPQLLMRPGSLQGQPVVTPVNIPVAFTMQPGAGGTNTPGHITAPVAMAWLEAPSYADLATAYPKKARDGGLAGHATLNCTINARGVVEDCTTLSEEPKGQGFGAAAHNLARKFRAPPTLGGQSLAQANVQLPFSFHPSILTADKPAIGKPQWVALPAPEKTAAAFAAVTKAGIGGTVRVAMTCTVQPGGAVANCAVTREEPAGQGVGEAALSLAPEFRVSTWTAEGLPTVGGTVNIPLRYEGDAKTSQPAKP